MHPASILTLAASSLAALALGFSDAATAADERAVSGPAGAGPSPTFPTEPLWNSRSLSGALCRRVLLLLL